MAERNEMGHADTGGPASRRTRLLRRGRSDRGRDGGRAGGASSDQPPASLYTQTNLRGVLRAAGRVVLWAFLGLVFVRGLGDVVGEEKPRTAPTVSAADVADAEMQSFAVLYARAYLTAPTAGASALPPLVSDELTARGLPERTGRGRVTIAQATVAGEQRVAARRVLITVACEVTGAAATRYVVVPVARDSAGRLGVFAAPALVAGPQLGRVEPDEPLSLEGTDAPAIRELAERFVTGYLSDEPETDFGYLIAPGVQISPPGQGVELVEVTRVGQLAAGDGAHRSILVDARVRDHATRSIYPLSYRLELVRRDRWYVSAVGGDLR